MLELPDRDFKTAITKMLECKITNTQNKSISKERYKEPNGNFRTEKYNHQSKTLTGLNSRMEMAHRRVNKLEDR